MEFIHKGGIPSVKLFYLNLVVDPFTGETLEDFGFKEDCVVMTQDEYETLKKERSSDERGYKN